MQIAEGDEICQKTEQHQYKSSMCRCCGEHRREEVKGSNERKIKVLCELKILLDGWGQASYK